MKNNRQLLLTFLALMLLIVVILLGVFLSGDDASDEDEQVQTEEPNNDTELNVSPDAVGVLVVDVFVPTEDYDLERDGTPDGENCLATPSGQGHVSLQGAGHVSLQGAGHVSLQGAGNVVFHGEVVYSEFEMLLENEGGRLLTEVEGRDAFGESWVRIVQLWELENEREVLLVGIDTIGYSTDVIANRIPTALDLLENELGLSRFVVNMSFAVVPCDSFLEGLTDALAQNEYRDILAQEFPELADLFDRLISEDSLDAKTALVTVLNLSITPPEARIAVDTEVLIRTTQSTYQEQEGESISGYLVECYPLSEEGISPAQQDTIITPTVDPDTDGKGLVIPECDDPIFADDPLMETLREVVVRDADVEDGRRVINIASAGNADFDFAFAPGYYPSVVSVSAEFSSLPASVGNGVILTSNGGEVQMDGVYEHDGLFEVGTSFAAPRLSVEAALYLLNGGEISCVGGVASSSPPLAHLGWDDLARADAGRDYCTEFNALVP